MSARSARIVSALVDAAAVVAAWAGLLLAENVAVGFLWREQFSGGWEVALARHIVVPMALAALAPAALVVVGAWRLALRAADGSRAAAHVIAALGALSAGAVALGVSNGRHFASWGVRAPFVLALALAGAFVGAQGIPRAMDLSRRPVALGVLGLSFTAASWLTDAYVLPRLYPAFHLALLVATLSGAAATALGARVGARPPGPVARALAVAVALSVLGCAAWTARAWRLLDRATNVRIVLVEHAPLLGRAVAVAMRLRPPPSVDPPATSAVAAPSEVARSLDWTGHDVVLVSVDALRADHVSAYGYPRPTTPNLDGLAREGTLFESAYCPTPHTSYSITSMMTGKYMRPLLALGLGEDAETWAQDLRRYGWRTAAFYPPAVFFIDEVRFSRFERERLGFEYAKVEFADPALRERQIAEYLDGAPPGRPLFLWVHFFEPHEPYVAHALHVFVGGASRDVDAYDGEVAEADDGIGRVVRLVRARRPGAVVMVTADHGEEFGEHGGRYHGTSVYEEQVRVPLVVVGPGVRAGARASTVVQTIDLLPTTLSALAIPRPARLRGRDLGPLLSGDSKSLDAGLAFAETDDYALVASGPERLVCDRRAAACAVYRPADDPLERRDVSAADPGRFEQLRALLRATERDHGHYEAAEGPAWPEALRRGMQGEAEVAADVASLLDDVDPGIRRKAAEVCFALHAPGTAPQVNRALKRDEDDQVRRWSALALARMGEPMPPLVETLLHDASRDWRRRAALALAERGDARACEETAAWWVDVLPQPGGSSDVDDAPPRLSLDLVHAQELLAATARARCRSAVPALVRALDDVRARASVADALGDLGDDRARRPLLALLANEPYVTTRPHEARALVALGARDWSSAELAPEVHATLPAPAGPTRLVALLSDSKAALEVSADGGAALRSDAEGEVRVLELGPEPNHRVRLDMRVSSGGIVAMWIFPSARLD
jgi:hypothetical protein